MPMKPPAFDIPPEMRDFAEKSVDQARKAFGEFVDAAQKAVTAADQQTKTSGFAGADVGRQALAYFEENVEATLALARRLVQARTMEEMAALQQEFFRAQAQNASEQAKGMSKTIATAAGNKPKRG